MTLDEKIDAIYDELQDLYCELKNCNNKGRVSQAILYLEDIDMQKEEDDD